MESGNFTYYPATSPANIQNCMNKAGDKVTKMFWWHKEGWFKYNYLLISAHYGLDLEKSKKMDTSCREAFLVPDSAKVFGDSGGFQAWTLGKIIPNQVIIDWYEKNCDYGFIQDFPEKFINMRNQMKAGKIHIDSKEVYKRMAEYQAESNVEFLKAKLSKCKLYNILHGDSLEQMDYWFETVKNDKMFGWGVPVRPPDPFKTAFLLAFFHSKGIKENVHLLGCSGYDAIPVIAYASKWISNITFDSSSWAGGSMYRAYSNPLNIRQKFALGDKAVSKYEKLPCDCPVCSKITNTKAIYEGTGIAGNILSLHNLYWLLWFIERIKDLTQVPSDFKEMIKTSFSKDVLHSMDYLEMAMKDFSGANIKYRSMLNDRRSLLETTEKYEESGMISDLYPEPEKKSKKKKKLESVEDLI